MGNSKHNVKIRAFPPGSHVYCWSSNNLEVIRVFALKDDDLSSFVGTDIQASFSDESLWTSHLRDDFRNTDCYHTFHDMEAVFDFASVPGITYSSPWECSQGRVQTIFKNGSHFMDTYLLGEGSDAGAGHKYRHTVLTETEAVLEDWVDGHLWLTRTRSIISMELPKDLRQHWGVTLQVKSEYSDYAISHGMSHDWEYCNTHYEYHYPEYVGDAVDFHCDLPALKQVIAENQSIKIREHFVPDDFINQVFSRMTIPDVNNIENLKDLKEIRKSIPPILNILRRRSFKSFSEFYLWYKYTYKTTELDLKAYYTFFQKWIRDSQSSSNVKRLKLRYSSSSYADGLSASESTFYEIITDPYDIGVLRSLGLDLNLSNTWDLLPFSFVIDWFINIGDILAKIDHSDVIAKLKIHSVLTTTKRVIISQPLTAFGCRSLCCGSYYYRTIDHVLPLGKLELSFKNCGTHLLDGSALILANTKK